jgi:hypothetical protein
MGIKHRKRRKIKKRIRGFYSLKLQAVASRLKSAGKYNKYRRILAAKASLSLFGKMLCLRTFLINHRKPLLLLNLF